MNFSVLMSVYKNDPPEAFRTALESVTLNQTLRPAQTVIVLDGPVHGEIEPIVDTMREKCGDVEFCVIAKEKNAGLAAALNDGLAACKYEWVARMDSDDISLSDRFQKQIAYLEKNPEVSLLGGTISEFLNTPGDMQSERHVGLTHDDIMKMAKKRTPFNHPSVIYRKSEVLRSGGYAVDFGRLEDYKLWVDMLSCGVKGANLDDIIVHARVGNGFIERRSDKREITDWDMLQKYLLKSGMINKREARKNKLYIRAFIYMPGFMKKIAYKVLLRA